MKKKRILHVVGGMNIGGVETWLLQVLRGIDRDNYKIDLLVHTDEKCFYDDEVRDLGCLIIPCMHPSQPIKYIRNFKRIIREYGPYDVIHIHVHLFSGLLVRLAYSTGIPIRIVHSRTTFNIKDRVTLTRKVYNVIMRYWIKKYATNLLAISWESGVALFGLDVVNRGECKIITTAIDLKQFDIKVDGCKLRENLGIPRNAKVIGHVGRFYPQKNHDFLLKIASHVIHQRQNIWFLLIGDGPMRGQIEKQAHELGLSDRVIFTGMRQDVNKLMLGVMNMFIFPSKFEGLGRVVIEAQAAGLPCLISDAIPEEAVVVKPLIKRLSLSQPLSDWVNGVFNALDNKFIKPQQEEALEILKKSKYNICRLVKELEYFYGGH